jgi:hypothetical protein
MRMTVLATLMMVGCGGSGVPSTVDMAEAQRSDLSLSTSGGGDMLPTSDSDMTPSNGDDMAQASTDLASADMAPMCLPRGTACVANPNSSANNCCADATGLQVGAYQLTNECYWSTDPNAGKCCVTYWYDVGASHYACVDCGGCQKCVSRALPPSQWPSSC